MGSIAHSRWIKESRYYEIDAMHDLFDAPCVVITYGRCGTPQAQRRTYPYSTEQEALDAFAKAEARRKKRGYTRQ